jgi:purine-binding chemotaxis protein CheW
MRTILDKFERDVTTQDLNRDNALPENTQADLPATMTKEFRRRAQVFARRERHQQTRTETSAVLVFELSTERYGIDLSRIVQVYPYINCSPIPGARSELLGVVNIRGHIYSVLDLAQILGLSKHPDACCGCIVLVRHDGFEVGLRVDVVDQIDQVAPDQLASTSDDLDSLSTPYVQGRTVGGLSVLNLAAVFSHPVFSGSRQSGTQARTIVNHVNCDAEQKSAIAPLELS